MNKNLQSSKNSTSCCGSVGPRRKIKLDAIPDNPKVKKGVGIIYLGAGIAKFSSKLTGLTYYAADNKRFIKIDPDDQDQLLKRKEFILAP